MYIYRIPTRNKKFKYLINGKLPVSKEDMERIQKLRIPPNWSNVKITTNPNSHLQVTGLDNKNRTQYIYHPMWVKLADYQKYKRMEDFSKCVSKFETKIKQDTLSPSPKTKQLAMIFIILKNTHIRVGNECYAKENNTYGLVTLEKRHIKLKPKDTIQLSFVGKKSVKQELSFRNKIVYNYLKENLKNKYSRDRVFSTSGAEVNNYLKAVMGGDFTCKDFRTYASNLLFLKYICNLPIPETQRETKKNLKDIYDKVADKLGHTRAISKKSYVMPIISEKYLEQPDYFFGKNPKSVFKSIFKEI